jgi:hypothetical protein
MTRRTVSLLLVVLWLSAGCGRIAGPTAARAAPTTEPVTPTLTASPPATLLPATEVPTAVPKPDPLRSALNAPLSSNGYRIPLITRHATQHEAVLEFELDQPAKGQLLVGTESGTSPPVAIPFDTTGGMFTASGLEPNTRYQAAVALTTADGLTQPVFQGQAWGEVSFKTQPEIPSEFRVAVVGDSGFGQPETAQLGSLMATYAVDFTIHTGDLVYNLQDDPSPPAGFQTKLFAPFAPLLRSAPFYPSLGNHDLEAAATWQGEAYALRAFPPFTDPIMPDVKGGQGGWYAFSQRGIQFVVLNSQVIFGYPGRTEETDWLAKRLADSRFPTTIVVLHVPLYNAGNHILDSVPVRGSWGDMITAADVPLVLAGHDHNYQRFNVAGRAYVISGGGSTHLYRIPGRDPNLVASARATHFVLLTFTATEIEIQAIDLAGQVLDEAQIPWSGWPVSNSPSADQVLAGAPASAVGSSLP